MSEFNISEDAQSGGEYSGSQSSTNNDPSSLPIESAFPDEDEETVTMVDVLEREDKLEDEASAVLGNSDEKNCTYPKGYITRQALYSCATCSEGPDKMAAICLACSLECHDNHEVFELYTKRNYRCDCGNSKFKKDFECKLVDKQAKKAPLNEKNKYNHNFIGKYCICDKRYPPDENDDSAEANDEMLQCIVCEDWYHTKHLGIDDDLPAKFDELICGPCVEKLEFVHYYKNLDKIAELTNNNDVSSTIQTTDVVAKAKVQDSSSVDPTTSVVSTQDQETIDSTSHQDSTESPETTLTTKIKIKAPESAITISESDTNDSQMENKDPIGAALDVGTTETLPTSNECLLQELKKNHSDELQQSSGKNELGRPGSKMSPIFWLDCSWRSKLCKCSNCMSMYKEKDCEYLLDETDTVQYYEAQGRAISKDRGTPFERGMSALNGMNRTAVVEALHGYDELKADLSSYLRKFADTKKVVREEDIHDFFAQLKSKKRPRLEYE